MSELNKIQPLYTVVTEDINKQTYNHRNKNKLWEYGYDAKHDIVVISKTGVIGEVYCINGVNVALPRQPAHIEKRIINGRLLNTQKNLPRYQKWQIGTKRTTPLNLSG